MRNVIWIAMATLLIFIPNTGLSVMDHSWHAGKLIRETSVEGYALAYHLTDMREKLKDMQGMPEMSNTHRLKLYIVTPNGKPAQGAKVGYLVQGPTGEKQKLMAKGMGDGNGADVNMGKMGAYDIQTKIVIGGKKMMDRFEYHMH